MKTFKEIMAEAFVNLPGKATHLTNKDLQHPEHGVIAGSTTLRHLGGDNYEVRAGRAKGKTIAIDKQHVQRMDEEAGRVDEAVSVKKDNYSWGKMVTVHHGADTSYPLHPEHQAAIKKLKDGESTSFKDETNSQVKAEREGDRVHFSRPGESSKKTTVPHSHFSEEVEHIEEMDKLSLRGLHTANPQSVPDHVAKTQKGKQARADKNKQDLKWSIKTSLGKHTKPNLPEEVELEEAAPFKTKEDAIKYAKDKVKTHRDDLDGIEIHAHSGGFDVNHTSNSSGRNSLKKMGAKHVGTIYKEEVEQIEEISKGLAQRYSGKAGKEMDRGFDTGYPTKKTFKRMSGVYSAQQRVHGVKPTSEEVEQIEEVSKDTLASYYAKSIGDRHSKDLARDSAKRKGDEKEAERLGNKIYNRSVGLEKSKTKFFAKEDVAQLDELSKTTLKSYGKKAIADMQASQEKTDSSLAKANSSMDKGDEAGAEKHYGDAMKAKDRTERRIAGVTGALKRVQKEEVELDESVDKHPSEDRVARSIKSGYGDGMYDSKATGSRHKVTYDGKHYRAGMMRSSSLSGLLHTIDKKVNNKPMGEEVELDEAVEISHDRYERSHGKKAKDVGPTRWMFTSKRFGDVNHKDEKEFHQAAHGSFADAKKSASKWAKQHGHSTAYVMENATPSIDSYVDAIRALTGYDTTLAEKKLTSAELKKREEVAKAMDKAHPEMNMGKKMAIATSIAKKVAEGKDEGKTPESEKEKDLAAAAHPKDKITHKDVLVKRGVIAKEESELNGLQQSTPQSYAELACEYLTKTGRYK